MQPARPAPANGAHLNGDTNGHAPAPPSPPALARTDQEIVRLIAQHLISIGLESSAAAVMQEAGLQLEPGAAGTFRAHVLAGDWAKADHSLRALADLLRADTADAGAGDGDGGASLTEIKFLVLEQKYLEHLEAGRALDALHVLRNELTPLQHDTARVHRLSALMMCGGAGELRARAAWPGAGAASRAALLQRVQARLPPAVMLAPARLRHLLAQAQRHQAARCRYHVAPRPDPDPASAPDPDPADELPYSLLADHACSPDAFPLHPLQTLSEHCDEVWFCRWSPDGLRLATGSKDNTVMVWQYEPRARRLSFRKSLEGHTYGVSYLAWSPDGRYLIAAGPEDCPDLWIWNMETETLHAKMNHSQEDSLTAVAWAASSARFACGGARGQFYLCALDGGVLHAWDGVRVTALAARADGTLLAADTHHRVRAYRFADLSDRTVLQEEHAVMAMVLAADDKLLLLNVANQGVHLWDVDARALVRRFRGLSQGHFTIHACFGGAHEDFLASGSEDNKVYVWRRGAETPLAALAGHSRCVNAVAWNPRHADALASVSDDYTVRLWGPRPRTHIHTDTHTDIHIDTHTHTDTGTDTDK